MPKKESKSGEARNPGFSSDTKAKGFGAEGMSGKNPTQVHEGGAVETAAEKMSNQQREDKGS